MSGTGPQREPYKPLVVFDFDHTLYEGDSGSRFVYWLLRRHLPRLVLALLVTPVLAPLFLAIPLRRYAISTYFWIATIGFRRADLDRLLDRYVEAEGAGIAQHLIPVALEALHAHREAGDRVIIATGAPPGLVGRILAAVAHEPVPVIGTEIQPFAGGLRAQRHCHGPMKLRMLREAGFTGEISAAYTDGLADIPLLREARRPVLVNPRARSLAAFQRALGEEVEVRYWRRVEP